MVSSLLSSACPVKSGPPDDRRPWSRRTQARGRTGVSVGCFDADAHGGMVQRRGYHTAFRVGDTSLVLVLIATSIMGLLCGSRLVVAQAATSTVWDGVF